MFTGRLTPGDRQLTCAVEVDAERRSGRIGELAVVVAALVVMGWWCVEWKRRMERTSHAFVQLESKRRHGRELAIGWSDGAGDMAATGEQSEVCGRPGTRSGASTLLGKWVSMVWIGIGLCGLRTVEGEKKVGKSERGEKGDGLVD